MRKGASTILGLDLGGHSIKAVVASANGTRLRIRLAEELPLPLDPSGLSKTLSRWVEEQGLGKTPVVVSVGGSRVLYQHVKLEDEDPRTQDQVATMEAMRFREMTDADMEATATPASELKEERALVVSMARSEHLGMALDPVVDADLSLQNACPAPIALYNGITSLGEPIHQPTLIVNLGSETTEMVIGDGQGVKFARTMAIGAGFLTQALANRASIPLQQAERQRLQASSFAELHEGMEEICERFVQQWHQEIEAGLQLYRETPAGRDATAPVQRMILCGGGARWQPLNRAITSALPLNVSTPGVLPGLEGTSCDTFVIASGLAADGLHIARASSSLLVPQVRLGLNRQRNKRYWALTSIFSILAFGVVGASTKISLNREQKQLSKHNRTLQRSEAIQQESETLLAKQRQVESMIAPLSDFVTNSSRVRDITLLIALKKGQRDFITFVGDSESYLQLRLDSADDRARRVQAPRDRLAMQKLDRLEAERLRSARMNRLIVEGFTPQRDLSSVKALIEALRELDSVERADLLSDNFVFPDLERDAEWQLTRSRRFVLDIRLTGDTPPEVSP